MEHKEWRSNILGENKLLKKGTNRTLAIKDIRDENFFGPKTELDLHIKNAHLVSWKIKVQSPTLNKSSYNLKFKIRKIMLPMLDQKSVPTKKQKLDFSHTFSNY